MRAGRAVRVVRVVREGGESQGQHQLASIHILPLPIECGSPALSGARPDGPMRSGMDEWGFKWRESYYFLDYFFTLYAQDYTYVVCGFK